MKVYVRKRCDRCRGSGETDCRACGGDGYSWYGGQCTRCGGLGWEDCPDCNGAGYVEEEENEEEDED